MSKRFLLTLLTLFAIGVATAVAIFLAKGYRVSPKSGMITGTGIIAVASVPDQASVYLNGHLTTATNTNINSLTPNTYDVKILKEGYIPWEKKVEVKEGLVTDIKATLFRAIPTIYPLTYTGAVNPIISPDGQRIVFVIPEQKNENPLTTRKAGLWVWEMGERPIGFNRGAEPHQISLSQNGIDYTKATLRWSPDSTQVLATFPDRQLLLDSTRLNDPPRDLTAVLSGTLKEWEEDQKSRDLIRLNTIKDLSLRKVASESAYLKWSPDENRILYSQNGKTDYKVTDLLTYKTYNMPQSSFYGWLPDSNHLVMVESQEQTPLVNNLINDKNLTEKEANTFKSGKISIVEYDGHNKSEMYAGNFAPESVFVWPDGSRLVIVSSFPTATASQPNLYGINLK